VSHESWPRPPSFNHLREHQKPRAQHVARRSRPDHQNQPNADDSEKARHGSPVPQGPAVNLSLAMLTAFAFILRA